MRHLALTLLRACPYPLGVALALVVLAGCGGGQKGAGRSAVAGSSLDAQISAAAGYRVTDCRPLAQLDTVAQHLDGERVYQCSGGQGAVIAQDGSVSFFPVPQTGPPALTAAGLSARIAAKMSRPVEKWTTCAG